MNRLTENQFRDSLRKGLGRAVLHVRHFGIEGLEDTIIEACLHSLVYDAFCEGTRGRWLHVIVELAGLTQTAIPRVLNALQQPSSKEELWDVAQLYELTALFAKEGHNEARSALYEKFDRQEFSESWLGGIQILSVDGLSGFLHIAEVIGGRFFQDAEYWEDTYLISETYERLGREIVRDALAARSRDNENVRKYLENIDRVEQQHAERTARKKESLKSAEIVCEEIDSLRAMPRSSLMIWGRNAAEDEIAAVCDHMASEHRTEQLQLYLQVFRMRKMPWLAPHLLELMDSDDGRLRFALARGLAHIQNPALRALAIRLLKKIPPRFEAVRLLANNFEPGDGILLASLLPTVEAVDTLHSIGLDLLEITDDVCASEFTNCLLWLYEHGPCSNCRESAMRRLVEMNLVPTKLLEECLWDCNEDTRALAQSAVSQ